jgi:hypothetical protein
MKIKGKNKITKYIHKLKVTDQLSLSLSKYENFQAHI